ncbi:MAG: hypothetical protein QJR02_07310 [Sinobacteraceae bacterium]|nr:hypothetical protein [Nevskiaceae bacterium]
MSESMPISETRSEVIFRHTRRMLHERRISMPTFSQSVVERYVRSVAEAARCVQFQLVGDPFRAATANAQKLARYMDPCIDARLPVDLEEAWVFSLVEPYRTECVRELAARYGLLDVPLPCCTADDLQSVGRLSREFGRAIQSMAPLIDDGRIDADDAPHLDAALTHIRGLLAAAEGLAARVEAAKAAAMQAQQKRARVVAPWKH